MNKLIDYIYNVEKDVISYGTADFAMYLYGLIKMVKPKNIVEFGTGLGVTSFMAAQACKDNKFGYVSTIDDGSQNVNYVLDYFETLDKKIEEFELKDYINVINSTLSSEQDIHNAVGSLDNVGVVFNDFNSEPQVLYSIINWLIPRIDKECYFFTDRGATYEPNKLATKEVVTAINNSVSDITASYLFVEKKVDSSQDSFSLIKLERG
jgi:tRNA A58 N-methylase Trm61